MNNTYDYFFEWTIEQCSCIVLSYLLSDNLIEQWFTIVLSSRPFIVPVRATAAAT